MTETPINSTRVKDTTGLVTSIVIKVAGAGMFSGISLLLSFVSTRFIPRFGWGLAWFDPVSVIWILAYFVFGYETGILTSVVGMFLLFPFDPYAPIGPVFKFAATIPLILTPLIIDKIRKNPITSENTLKMKHLGINWLISLAIRLVIMIPMNVLAIIFMFPGVVTDHSLSFLGMNSVGGWLAIVITVIFSNLLQSIFDYLVPIMLIKPIQIATPLLW